MHGPCDTFLFVSTFNDGSGELPHVPTHATDSLRHPIARVNEQAVVHSEDTFPPPSAASRPGNRCSFRASAISMSSPLQFDLEPE
jgi:hypothetical protein